MVTALIFDDFETLDLFGVVEVFGRLPNEYQCEFVSLQDGLVTSSQNVRIQTKAVKNNGFATDILLIVGGIGTQMQINNSAINNLPPQVQQILPMLSQLNFEQRFTIIDYLYHLEQQPIQEQPQKLSSLDRQYLKGAIVSDDFDECLGDDFWFPEDDILYK